MVYNVIDLMFFGWKINQKFICLTIVPFCLNSTKQQARCYLIRRWRSILCDCFLFRNHHPSGNRWWKWSGVTTYKVSVLTLKWIAKSYKLQNVDRAKSWIAYPFALEAKPGELWITTMQGGLQMKLLEKIWWIQSKVQIACWSVLNSSRIGEKCFVRSKVWCVIF